MRFWRFSKMYRARPPSARRRAHFLDRQAAIDGFPIREYPVARIGIIGLGAQGSWIAYYMMLKSAGHLIFFDDDIVEDSNLTRQFFALRDVGEYKVRAAAKYLISRALFPLTVKAHPKRFQELYSADDHTGQSFDLLICGPDNNPTRRAVAAFGHAHSVPVIFPALGRDANACTIFIQEPDHACWACANPQLLNDNSYPCGVPGVIDICAVAAGHTVHAADTVIGDRPREWNNRTVYLDGGLPDRAITVERNPDCPICSKGDLVRPASPNEPPEAAS